jgi:hypothetical protein
MSIGRTAGQMRISGGAGTVTELLARMEQLNATDKANAVALWKRGFFAEAASYVEGARLPTRISGGAA